MRKYYLILGLVTLMVISCQKKEETTIQNQAEKTETIVSKSKVVLPKFDDMELNTFVKEYDEFMNQALNMYDEYTPGSQEAINNQREYIKDAEIYLAKLSSLLENAPATDVAKFQEYILAKQQEMQEATEKMVNQ